MTPAVILVLSNYADLFSRFQSMVDELEPSTFKILIRSSRDITPPGNFRWLTRTGVYPFSWPRNVNLGFQQAPKSDIVLIGDDVQVRTFSFVSILRDIAYSDPTIGFCVPELGGQSAFVMAYIKRALIDQVGPLDETFDTYGYADNDYYHRFEAAGWRTQPTTLVRATHGGATSFRRIESEGGESVQASCDRGRSIFNKKWGTNL